MDYSEAKKLVKARLSEKRWTHTKNVKKMAVKLARRWGTDPEKAAMAAHNILFRIVIVLRSSGWIGRSPRSRV
mgnify:CR=1 FL=1